MHYYSHHIGDFNNATRHLTRIERSLYRDMIELYYETEKQLPKDISVLCRRIIADFNECSTTVQQILNEFFIETQNGWYHKRCEYEIDKFNSSMSQKAAAGRASAEKRALKAKQALNECSTSVEIPLNDTPTNQEPRTNKPLTNIKNNNGDKSPEFSEGFLKAWDAYPTRPGNSKKDAYKQWKARLKAGCTEEEMIEGAKRYADYVYAMRTEAQYIKQAQTFFGVGEHFKTQWETSSQQPAKAEPESSYSKMLRGLANARN